MPRATLQYIVLAMLFACAAAKQTGETWSLIDLLRHAATLPDDPVSLAAATRTVSAGPFRNDQLLAFDGHPLTGWKQFEDTVRARRPGDRMRLTLSEPSGTAIERDVKIPSQKRNFERVSDIAVAVCLDLAIPIIAMGLGFAAAFIRPRDKNAW